jgi:hypothetical protein
MFRRLLDPRSRTEVLSANVVDGGMTKVDRQMIHWASKALRL